MRRFTLVILLSWLLLAPASQAAKDQWTSVKTKNFHLVGNAASKDLRRIAVKLEQFRYIFARLFPKAQFKTNIPLRVIVFQSRVDYQPFMPVYQGKTSDVAGYFLAGQDVHHITLTAEMTGEHPYRTIFHEYAHALLNDNTRPLPAWFNEGLAEYYGSFELKDDKTIVLGQPITAHLSRLRTSQFMPLAQLFAVNHGSAEYNENEKKTLFYAEAWALVHYLMLGNEGKRQPQVVNYLGMLAKGTDSGAAFQQAFQTDFATMEKELREYTARNSYAAQQYVARERFEFDDELTSEPVSEAEAQYYLGDLAVHLGYVDGEPYLEKALALDASLAVAHASLGLAKMRAGKLAEAKRHLQNALELNTKNALVPYYYALALYEEKADPQHLVSELPEVTAAAMRGQLKRAIALDPAFSEAYRLLAFVHLVTNENLNEAVTLLTRAIELNPGRSELGYTLGQIYYRQQKFDEARKTLEPIAKHAAEPKLREQAASLLASVKRVAEQNVRYATDSSTRKSVEAKSAEDQATTYTPRPALRRRFDGEKAEGLLLKMECGKGLTLTLKGAKATWQFHASAPERVQFVTPTQNANESFACGTLNPAPRVIITYRYNTDAQFGYDGELIAVEFVKQS